jgi:DNA-binding NarL/FixJ family response regulator
VGQIFPRAAVKVCVVAQNCLVEAYLCQVLKRHRLIRALTLKQFMLSSPLQRSNTVFIVDQCGLEVPLAECLRHLRPRSVDPRFLILDHAKSKDGIVHLLAMGAHGYVPHAEVSQALVRAIFFVAANELWVPHDAFREFLSEAASVLRKDARSPQATTPREEEILEHRKVPRLEYFFKNARQEPARLKICPIGTAIENAGVLTARPVDSRAVVEFRLLCHLEDCHSGAVTSKRDGSHIDVDFCRLGDESPLF